MFVLRRTDGAYAAPHGSVASYTRSLQFARIFNTREAAEQDRCPDNERVVSVADCLHRQAYSV